MLRGYSVMLLVLVIHCAEPPNERRAPGEVIPGGDSGGGDHSGAGDHVPPGPGCECDATAACDGYCYCDADCENSCACDATPICDDGCGCDVGCQTSSFDLYPYNLCTTNQSCIGGYCAKGICVFFCDDAGGPSPPCGYGFECTEDVCLYTCDSDGGCMGHDDGDCCRDGVCLPPNMCADATGAPDGWTCSAAYYGSGDGCDCGCGRVDADCDGSGCDWCYDGATLGVCP